MLFVLTLSGLAPFTNLESHNLKNLFFIRLKTRCQNLIWPASINLSSSFSSAVIWSPPINYSRNRVHRLDRPLEAKSPPAFKFIRLIFIGKKALGWFLQFGLIFKILLRMRKKGLKWWRVEIASLFEPLAQRAYSFIVWAVLLGDTNWDGHQHHSTTREKWIHSTKQQIHPNPCRQHQEFS